MTHEDLSLLIMQALNTENDEALKGKLTLAIQIFTNQYPKKFLHQLISGQLDVDRLDYLNSLRSRSRVSSRAVPS